MVRANCLNEMDTTDRAVDADFLAFSVIIFMAKRSNAPGLGIPGLLSIIAKDAARYFVVIFTSHAVFAITLGAARVSGTISFSLRRVISNACDRLGNDSTSSRNVSSREHIPEATTLLLTYFFTVISGITV